MMMTGTKMWQELLPAPDGGVINDLIKKQYDLIDGEWPTAYNEVVLVVNERNEIDDLTLYALGLIGEEEIDAIIDAAVEGKKLDKTGKSKWSYKEVKEQEFKTVLPFDKYEKPNGSNVFVDISSFSQDNMEFLYSKGLNLKIKGIIRPNPDSESHMLTGSLGYTYKLTEHVIDKAKDSEVVKAQLLTPDVDVLTGLPFKSTTGKLSDEEKLVAFKDYVYKLTDEQKAEKYIGVAK